MAFTKKRVDSAAEEAAGAPAPKKKGKGKMPAPGASKPKWAKIADQMTKC